MVDRIAAGEVIERPASVVKELVENSIDAGASHIVVSTTAGGLDSILVQDNGTGIAFDELPTALMRHATSKINQLEDLEHIFSYGFRGEALAAISSISLIEIRSTDTSAGADQKDQQGGFIRSRGGTVELHQIDAPSKGTTIHIQDLFYTTPARRKFIKSERAEDAAIYKEMIKLAVAAPEIHFEYFKDEKQVFNLTADANVINRISAIFGPELCSHLLYIEEQSGPLTLTGYIGDDRTYRRQSDRQFLAVNRRPVEIRHVPFFVRKAYHELIPDGGKPVFFLHLEADSARLDVNVHPAKKEVRLTDESLLHNLIMTAAQRALFPDQPLPFLQSKASHEFAPQSAGTASVNPQYNYFTSLHDSTTRLPSQASQPTYTAPTGNSSPLLYPTDALLSSTKNETSYTVQEKHGSSSEFVPLRHFGIIFGTYILAEGDDEFYIIDQHTAHERINFEKKRRELESRRFERQILLHPIALDYNAAEAESILAQSDQLKDAGFVIEAMGTGKIVVREVPDFLEPGEEKELVEHAIERLTTGEPLIRVYDEYAAMKACKASIKRNDFVSPEIISTILRQLGQCEQPSRCPHGRPTVMRLSRSQLDQMFLRTGFAKSIHTSDHHD